MTYLGLHGFLGLPSDMEKILPKGAFCPNLFNLNLETAVSNGKVRQDFELEPVTIGDNHSQTVKAPPIVTDSSSTDCANLPSLTTASRLSLEEVVTSFMKNKGKKILVGYSMGGRLALQILAKKSFFFDAAVIISSNPFAPENRESRLRDDLLWAERFLNKPWEELMILWEEQTWQGLNIFEGSTKVERREEDFNRECLANALNKWSLGRQEPVDLENLSIPILWVTGEKDIKYRALAEKVYLKHPLSQKVVIEGAGHRVLFDAAEELKSLIMDWTSKIIS